MMALFLFLLQVVMGVSAAAGAVQKHVAAVVMVVVVEALETKNNFGFLSSVLKTSQHDLVQFQSSSFMSSPF